MDKNNKLNDEDTEKVNGGSLKDTMRGLINWADDSVEIPIIEETIRSYINNTVHNEHMKANMLEELSDLVEKFYNNEKSYNRFIPGSEIIEKLEKMIDQCNPDKNPELAWMNTATFNQ